MKPALLIAVLLAAFCGSRLAWAQGIGLPYFELVAGTDQVGNGIVTHVAQDSRGLLWFGTPEGLYSYDGYRLRAYRHDPGNPQSLGDDYIRSLMAHSDGRLWVATQGAGLSIYDPGTDRFEHYQPDPGNPRALPGVATLTLHEDRDQSVWVGLGNTGLAHWDPLTRDFTRYAGAPGVAGALQHETARSVLIDRHGALWVGTGNGLHRRRDDGSGFDHVASEPDRPGSLAGQYVYSLMQARDGRLWIGTQSQGAAVYDPATGELHRIAPGPEGLGHPWVSGFIQPTAEHVWIHTYGGGIDIVDSADLRIAQRLRADAAIPGALALDRLTAPLLDRSGLVWIGSWGAGLQRHNPHNASTFTSLRHGPSVPNGLSMANVLSTLPLAGSLVWVGTGGNGIDQLDLNRGVVGGYRPDRVRAGALRDGTIRALAKAADGSIWVGTQHAGLQRYEPETDSFVEPHPGLPRGPIRRLLPRRDGRLAVGMQAALVHVDTRSGAVELARLDDGREITDAIWSLAEDRAGNLWVSSPVELYFWPAGEPTLRVVRRGDARLQAITDLEFDANDQLWLAGPRGLLRLRGWSGASPDLEDFGIRLPAQPLGLGQLLKFDHSGRLWTPRGLIDTEQAHIEPLGSAEGIDIGSVEIGSTSIDRNGRIYFGGTRGLLIIDPDRFQPWRPQPPLLITALDVDGQMLVGDRSRSELTLQPGQRRLTIEFAALDYAAPSSTGYAYRLVGLDSEWLEAGAGQRLASFHNLWPRSYQFELRARTRGGSWSEEPLVLPVRVLAAWWQTPLALVLGLLLLALLIGAGVRLRTLRMRQRAQALEELVERRTHELNQARLRAETALVDLKGAQRQLVAAEKMASLGQLVAGVAHEINTPIGIAVTAASHLQDIARDGSARLVSQRMTRSELLAWKDEVDAAGRLVLGSLERASTLVASFKQVSVDQSSGQRRRFPLQQFLREVQTSLQPSIRRTPHTLQIDCPEEVELDSYPGALFQIVSNLVNNALTHAYEPGQAGHLCLRAGPSGDQVQIEFSDDGRGMDAETAAHAFDPFFTTRRGSGGSGLGLHIVHNLVTQLLGGEIQIETAPGQGTRLRLHFALCTAEK